ncbi:MAG: hypothetical protein GKR91_04820 [Pseudomonadales bacterium]|nr:hypothetical protein [Pseudomonadales bacterium]
MLFIGTWVVAVVFWYYIYRITIRYGYKIPLIAALIWYAAFAARMFLGFGAALFVPTQALLSFFLIVLDYYKSSQSKQAETTDEDITE